MHATKPLGEESPVRYAIDTQGSNFVVQAFSTGLLSAFAHNPKIAVRDFTGEAELVRTGATLQNATMKIHIRADSLEVIDDISASDRDEIHQRMCREVLETDSFPEILYECPRITASGNGDRYWAALAGSLTLRGITRPLPISAKVVLDGNSLRATGEFTLRQTDYKIKLVTAAGGTIRVKDELRFTFDVMARVQE